MPKDIEIDDDIIVRVSKDLGIRTSQIKSTIRLLLNGNTVPFVARYRKEVTGSLDEEQIRNVKAIYTKYVNLETRRTQVIESIEEQGKMTEELRKALLEAETLQEIEDLYLPYKPKRRTRATIAKEKGLEPLALKMLELPIKGDKLEIASKFINPEKGVNNVEEALDGAKDIIAEMVSENAEYRKFVRSTYMDDGVITTKATDNAAETVYDMYYDFEIDVRKIKPHQILAINRGEKEGVLKVAIDVDHDWIIMKLQKDILKNPRTIFVNEIKDATKDGYKRLLAPSIEREVRSYLTEIAESHAIKVFAENLKNLLLQPPIRNVTVMGIDPGFRTGCKVAVVDPTGKLLDTATIYPHPPHNKDMESIYILEELIKKHKVDVIAIGNGTASRETEALVSQITKEREDVKYLIVSEAGASVYSASKIAREEFPDLDVSMRGAISIARRVLDPLAELVKIDPKSIGVGLYQHDVDQTKLKETLDAVVEDCVNLVGVNLNTASWALLRYVSGIGPSVAKNIEKYRSENGKFTNRKQLLKVKGLGKNTFTQAAGFLRIPDGDNPLDNTPVHPESYKIAEKILSKIGYKKEDLRDKEKLNKIRAKLAKLNPQQIAKELDAGEPTVKDIIDALQKPGRDPRDELPKPILRQDVLKIEDLKPGMRLKGVVRNVVDFGAFVDIGVKHDGLVHISEMKDGYVRDPQKIVSVGDVITVEVIDVDVKRERIALSMKRVKEEEL